MVICICLDDELDSAEYESEEFDPSKVKEDWLKHKGDAKITRKREEECITVCLHRMLGGRREEN